MINNKKNLSPTGGRKIVRMPMTIRTADQRIILFT
jgi:hypothetical protein